MPSTTTLTGEDPHGGVVSIHPGGALVMCDHRADTWRTYYAPRRSGTVESVFNEVVASRRSSDRIIIAQQDLGILATAKAALERSVPLENLSSTQQATLAIDDALRDVDTRTAALYVFAIEYAYLSGDRATPAALLSDHALIRSAKALRGELDGPWKVRTERFLAAYDSGKPFSIPALIRFGSDGS